LIRSPPASPPSHGSLAQVSAIEGAAAVLLGEIVVAAAVAAATRRPVGDRGCAADDTRICRDRDCVIRDRDRKMHMPVCKWHANLSCARAIVHACAGAVHRFLGELKGIDPFGADALLQCVQSLERL
jgi:hypothetical protein